MSTERDGRAQAGSTTAPWNEDDSLTRPFFHPDLPWGLNKGHPTTVRALPASHSNRKGKQSARTAFVKELVREVVGFAPYERRVMELIRNSKVGLVLDGGMVGSSRARAREDGGTSARGGK